MKHSLVILAAAALLGGCATQGKFDNVLTTTLPSVAADVKPRAFLNSTYMGLSIGAELREQDAQALAELLRIKAQHDFLLRLLMQQQAGRSQ